MAYIISFLIFFLFIFTSSKGEEIKFEEISNPFKFFEEVKKQGNKGEYIPPSKEELEKVYNISKKILEIAENDKWDIFKEIENEVKEIGFKLLTFSNSNNKFIALLESENNYSGKGGYIFRIGIVRYNNILLQAPHSFFDKDTFQIALDIFFNYPIKGFYFNTMHRYKIEKEVDNKKFFPCDVAHNPESYFQEMTKGYINNLENPLIIQIHGFSPKDLENSQIKMVLSTGKLKGSDNYFEKITKNMKKEFGNEFVKIYPEEISILGGETNVQGKFIAKIKKGGFLHIELSNNFRKELKNNEEIKRKFVVSLLEEN